jgi:site-specific DNA recombinase
MRQPTQGALYARVSSAQQAEAHTVARPGAAVRERVAAEGLTVSAALECLAAGESGATLRRPGLERLRDVSAAGTVDRLEGHAPDRLARQAASQGLLGEEVRQAGVAVVFVHRALGRSPEDALRLHVQGRLAAYERAKMLARHRRGKRHAARAGAVHVLRGAPQG